MYELKLLVIKFVVRCIHILNLISSHLTINILLTLILSRVCGSQSIYRDCSLWSSKPSPGDLHS